MTSRERLKTVLNFGIPDRVPMVDISYWPETLERWHQEGLPEDVSPEDYLSLDRIERIGFDGTFRLEEKVLEETQDYKIYTNNWGATLKAWKERYAPPSRLQWAVKTKEDWLKYKELLPVEEDRISEETWENYKKWEQEGVFKAISPGEPCWFVLEHVFGFYNTLVAMLEQPDLIHDMFSTLTDFILDMSRLCMRKGMKFDAFWMFADLCYKNGMLFSPRLSRELLTPYHKKISAFCREHNLPLLLHCDGDVREFVPLLIEAGFDAIQPLEARCGNDVREMKRLYRNQIVFFGNINVDVMTIGGAELEEEVKTKVLAAREGGGYIYHSDHSVPPTVSFENYKRVIELVREYGQY